MRHLIGNFCTSVNVVSASADDFDSTASSCNIVKDFRVQDSERTPNIIQCSAVRTKIVSFRFFFTAKIFSLKLFTSGLTILILSVSIPLCLYSCIGSIYYRQHNKQLVIMVLQRHV
jgi:hypothetical protein